MDNSDCDVELAGVSKRYPGVRALDQVDFAVRPGTVHAVVGANGAGKSTLMKVVAGLTAPDGGHVALRGHRVERFTPHQARTMGVGLVPQEPTLVPQLTVRQSLVLGAETRRFGLLRVDPEQTRAVEEMADTFELELDAQVEDLSPARRQLVSVAWELLKQPQILILDEPTASLTPTESDTLFQAIRDLRSRGRSVIYVSHRLAEVVDLADAVTVMREGRVVVHLDARSEVVEEDILIANMSGGDWARTPEVLPDARNDVFVPEMAGADLEVAGILDAAGEPTSFRVKGGAVLGITGLVGSGRTSLVASLAGGQPWSPKLDIRVDGRRVDTSSPKRAIAAGVALVPEDRHRKGFIPYLSIGHNITLSVPDQVSKFGFIRREIVRRLAEKYVGGLSIRCSSIHQSVETLSGGNQQKVVISKWLARGTPILIFDEPTKGIDIAAKQEVHREIRAAARAGHAVIVVTAEIDELFALADDALVMAHGRAVATLDLSNTSEQDILAASFTQPAIPDQYSGAN